jgi:hypothetical protein
VSDLVFTFSRFLRPEKHEHEESRRPIPNPTFQVCLIPLATAWLGMGKEILLVVSREGGQRIPTWDQVSSSSLSSLLDQASGVMAERSDSQ